MIFDLEAGGNTVRVVAVPAGFDGHAAPVARNGSPGMGEHTDALMAEVGYGAEQLADLRSRGLVQ